MVVVLALLIAALVCALLATFGVPTSRVQVGWLGIALVVLALIVERWPG
jgi:uncharacterized membrane protein YdcZ (DUF606 family)